MRTISVKPSPEARTRARALVADLCEIEVGAANLFGHLDIAHLIGPVDPGKNDSTLVIEFDALQRLVQTLTATTQTLLLLATFAAGREVGTEQLTAPLLARRRQIIDATFDAADDF